MSSCHHDTLLVTGHDKSVMVGGSQVWDQVFATGIIPPREACPVFRPSSHRLGDRYYCEERAKKKSISLGPTRMSFI